MLVKVDTQIHYKVKGEKHVSGPGAVDLPDEVANDLLKRGKAEKPESVVIEGQFTADDSGEKAPNPGTMDWYKIELKALNVEFPSDAKARDLKALYEKATKTDPNGGDGDGDSDNQITEQQIIDVITQLDPDDEDLWTDEGLPVVKVIEAELGADITEEQRDAAWKTYKGE